MHTVQPAIIIGSYGWDEDRLPRDEFAARRGELDRLMDRHGWQAMLIHADAREHGALAYYTNFVPRLRWAMALVPRRGEPRLLVSMSARDMPCDQADDVDRRRAHGMGLGRRVRQLARDARARGRGDRHHRLRFYRGRSLPLGRAQHRQPFPARRRRTVPAARARCGRARCRSRARRPRWLEAAVAAIAEAWQQGQGNEAAVLEGERAARAMAAQDVRTLASLDGGRTLAPFAGRFDVRSEPFLAYIAVKSAGFWAETFVGGSHPRAEAALDAALAAMIPGAEARLVREAAMAALPPLSLHPVLSGRVGRRIGFSLDEGGTIDAAAPGRIEPGSVYALHVGADAIASAMVAITKNAAEILWRSRALQSG